MALLPVSEALNRILSSARTLKSEQVKLSNALGRVASRDIKAKRNQPPFDASAMDGYAIRHLSLIHI